MIANILCKIIFLNCNEICLSQFITISDLQKVLKDFSLKIPRGSVVALVGLSGGGNSVSLMKSYHSCQTVLYTYWRQI